jgi:hypothetical protein
VSQGVKPEKTVLLKQRGNETSLPNRTGYRLRHRHFNVCVVPNRQLHDHRGALPGLRLDPHCPGVLLYDDVMNQGETLPGPFAHGFGGKERLEHTVANSCGNAAAIVLKR